MPPCMMREGRSIFIHQWTSTERHLTSGTHPSSLTSNFTLRAHFAWLCSIFVLVRLGDTNRNVLVFFTVMEANLDQILLDAEAVQCRVLHRPSLFPLPCFDDVINFLVGSPSCHRQHRLSGKCHFLLLTPIALCGVFDLQKFILQLIVSNDQFIYHGTRCQHRLVELLDEVGLVGLASLELLNTLQYNMCAAYAAGGFEGKGH
mmetsp:Transcript_14020/g.30521  ORF Transcript_14020/g.30521 Transcript_14020/m.30521 type:complete len:203 (+) Transcript_14020:319-927(+)